MRRKPMPLNTNTANCNTNNHHDYTPYVLKDERSMVLIIDEVWWQSLTPYIQQMMKTCLTRGFEIGNVTVPHPIQRDSGDYRPLVIAYTVYIMGFDYNVWYNGAIPNGPQNVSIIPISSTSKQKLLAEIVDEDLLIKISDVLQKANVPMFVRMSSTSGKNERGLEPQICAEEIMSDMIRCRLYRQQEYENKDRNSFLIMMPWNSIIDENDRFEFRIFVVNKRLVAVSPQRYWRQDYQYSSDDFDLIEEAIGNAPFINDESIEYKNYVGDVYVNTETRQCNLIEINPFGAHCGAGSSLFNWIDDYDLLHGREIGWEFRYLSAINY